MITYVVHYADGYEPEAPDTSHRIKSFEEQAIEAINRIDARRAKEPSISELIGSFFQQWNPFATPAPAAVAAATPSIQSTNQGQKRQPKTAMHIFNSMAIKKLNEVLKNIVDTLNTLLVTDEKAHSIFIPPTDSVNALSKVLEKIIPILKDLYEEIYPQSPINKTIIDTLVALQADKIINPIHVMKIIAQIELPGVDYIEFNIQNMTANCETIEEVAFPHESIPDAFFCPILSIIMSDPIEQFKTNMDRLIVNMHHENPYTRTPWPEKIDTNEELSKKIALFMKKIEWLYYSFSGSSEYQNLFKPLLSRLKDDELSYKDFCSIVRQKIELPSSQDRHSFFQQEHSPFPVKYILDLFAKNKMHTLKPSANEYERLVRRLVANGDNVGLNKLLTSPILEFVRPAPNFFNKNKDNKNALDLIDDYVQQYPRKRNEYELCRALLLAIRSPSAVAETSPALVALTPS